MKFISKNIPHSLQPYLDQFQEQPEKAIERLEKHIEKRGADAVGYYLLAWFFYSSDQRNKAINAAWKARIFAPGSPVMKELHYYMIHPDHFSAWDPSGITYKVSKKIRLKDEGHPILDLDALINKLANAESKKIQLGESQSDEDEKPDLSEFSAQVEDIVTETLAGIHERQGNREAAIKTFEELRKLHPDKAPFYQKEITRLQKELQENN